MNPPESALSRAARWLTFGSATSILFSIAVSQILLGLAVAALLLSGDKLRIPRIKWPLALFMLGTLVSLAFSGDPVAHGLPRVPRKVVFVPSALGLWGETSVADATNIYITVGASGATSGKIYVQY